MPLPSECPHPASPVVQVLKAWSYAEIGCDGSTNDPRAAIETEDAVFYDGCSRFHLHDLAEPYPVSDRDALCRAMRRLIGRYNESLAWLEETNALRAIWSSEEDDHDECDPPDAEGQRQWDLITDIVVWESMAAEKMLIKAILVNGKQAKSDGSPRPDRKACGWRHDETINQVIPNPDEDPDKENDYVVPPRLVTLADAAIDDENE